MSSVPASGAPGLDLRPFRPVTYGHAGDTAVRSAPPYDVISDRQRAELQESDPHNVVRLTLPDSYDEARQVLDAWLASGVLVQGEREALVVYEVAQRGTGQVTRGLVAAVALRDFEDGVILPHENTMKGPVADRLALTEATEANLESIMLAYRGDPGPTRDLLAAEPAPEAVIATAEVGDERHRAWAVTDPQTIAAVRRDMHPRRTVIADGHHRYATARAYQSGRRAEGGDGPWDATLAWLLDAEAFGPQVGAIHRVLPQLSFDDALQRAKEVLDVSLVSGEEGAEAALAAAAAAGERCYVITDGDTWAALGGFETAGVADAVAAAMPADQSAAWRALDVSVAHRFLVEGVWGLTDNESTVRYEHDVADAVASAQATGGTALLLNPTSAADVAAVAEAGDRMPRKSTLFTPKPRSGLVMRLLRD